MKSVLNWSFSGWYLPIFRLSNPYSVQIWQSSAQKICEYGHFLCSECCHSTNFINNSFTRACHIKEIGWVIYTKKPYKQKIKSLANREKVKIFS